MSSHDHLTGLDDQYSPSEISQVCSETVNKAVNGTKFGTQEDIWKEVERNRKVLLFCFLVNTRNLKPSATRDLPLEILWNFPSNTQGNHEACQRPGRLMNALLWCTPSNQPFQPPPCLHFLPFDTEIVGFSFPVLVKEASLCRSNKQTPNLSGLRQQRFYVVYCCYYCYILLLLQYCYSYMLNTGQQSRHSGTWPTAPSSYTTIITWGFIAHRGREWKHVGDSCHFHSHFAGQAIHLAMLSFEDGGRRCYRRG